MEAGDKFFVRKDLVVGKRYGNEYFVDGMKNTLGALVTIKEVHPKDKTLCKIKESQWSYWYTIEMLIDIDTYTRTEMSLSQHLISAIELSISHITDKEKSVLTDEEIISYLNAVKKIYENKIK